MHGDSNPKNTFALVAVLTGTATVMWAFSGPPSRREAVLPPELATGMISSRNLENQVEKQVPAEESPTVAALPLTAPFDEAKAKATQDAWARSLGKLSPIAKNLIGIELVLIPPGKFVMGSPPSEKDRHEDENQVGVTLTKPFYLAKTEVTQGQWRAVMGTTPWMDQSDLREGDDYPATNVSWHDARAFCKKLSEKEKSEYRLPSEAEWEYACRAGTTTRFSFGDDEESLSGSAWYHTNAGILYLGYAHEVGQLEKNSFGLHDMHGNVREWCEDMYVNNLPGGIDPLVSDGGTSRVFRGGGWATRGASCRAASRDSFLPSYRDCFVGFRVACSFVEKSAPFVPQMPPSIVEKSSTELDLILIPAGTFRMGNPAEGQVEVTLTKSFYLGKTEVTQAQWRAVMGTTPWKRREHAWEGDDFPATYVSWDDARAFCQKLSAMEGEVYRLPTEAEWEYACRGGTTTRFSFGDGEASLSDYAWWGGLYGEGNAKDERYAHEVGRKKPNPFGLYDMHGNVFEWCEDRYTERPPGGTDPLVSAGGWYRVNRGGSWYRRAVNCGSASRDDSRSRSQRSHDLGFRVARSYGP